MKLKELILEQSNDYSHLEKRVLEQGFALLSEEVTETPAFQLPAISVILPTCNVPATLPKTLLALESQVYRNFEVLVVDDASTLDMVSIINRGNCTYDLHYVRNSKNRDRSFVRNTGISIANGEVILVLDPDMVPNKIHLLNLAIRHHFLTQSLIVGFKHHVDLGDHSISDDIIQRGLCSPDYKKDWRYYREYSPEIVPPNFIGIKENAPRELYLLKESDYFKKFGKGKVIGAWDIPSLTVGHTLSFRKSDIIKVGGFAEEFVGWGHDDIAFGARVVANGYYVVPCTQSASYHINHPPHSGTFDKKMTEFRENYDRYLKYVDTDIKEIKFVPKKVRLVKRYENKFYYEGP